MRLTRVSGGSSVVSAPLALADYAASAYGASSANVVAQASSITAGAQYYVSRARTIRGVIFFWNLSGTNAETVKVSLWNAAGSRVTSVTVAVQSSGVHVALFSSSQSIAACALFAVSVFRVDGSSYPYFVSTNSVLKTPLGTTGAGVPLGGDLVLQGLYYASGDANPVTNIGPTSQTFPVTPLLDGVVRAETVDQSAARILLFNGDSITAGFGVTEAQAFPHLVGAAMSRPYVNKGHAGDHIADLTARISSSETPYVTGGPPSESVLIGYNDIATGSSAATAYSALQTYVAAVRAAGITRIAGCTMYTSAGSGAYASTIAAYNALILANSGGLFDLVIDVAASTGSITLSDGIHPDAAGQTVIAGVVSSALTAAGW